MAERGKPVDDATKARIQRLGSEGRGKTEIARIAQVSRPTAYKYAPKNLRRSP